MATTPNMGLNVTVQGSTPGPTYATYIDQNETIVDNHDHTPGKGLKITTAAININADLPMNGHNITGLSALTVSGKLTGGTYNDWSSIYSLSTAAGDGSTNDAAAFNTATAAIIAAGGGTLLLPRGTFFIGTNITIPRGCGVVFLSGASLKVATGITVTFLDAIVASPTQHIFQTIPTDVQPIKFGNPGTVGSPTTNTTGPGFASPWWWGTVADGVTDCWAQFQQCVWAFGYNPNPVPIQANANYGIAGTIFIPNGQYNLSKALFLGFASSGLTLLGQNRGYNNNGAFLFSKSGSGADCIVIGGETVTSPAAVATTAYVTLKNFIVSSNIGSLTAIHFLDAAKCRLEDMLVASAIAGQNALWINGGAVNGNVSNISIDHCQFTAASGATVPIVQIDGGATTVGQCSEIAFRDVEFNGSMTATAPQVQINANVAGGIGIQNIAFEVCRFEVPYGGALHNFGALNVSLRHCTAGDTAATNNAPLIKLRKGAGSSQLPNGFCIDQFWSDIGNSTANQATLDFDNNNPGQGGVMVLNSQLSYLQGGANSPGGPPVLCINSQFNNGQAGNPPVIVTAGNAADGIIGLGGISHTQTGASNLGGTLVITSGTNTVTVTFAVLEVDTAYQIEIGPPYGAALPAAGSNRIQRITKTTSGFTIVTEVNTAQNQSYDWFLFRA